MDSTQVLILACLALLIIFSKFIIGKTILGLFPTKVSKFENSIMVGWALTSFILYFCYRNSLPDVVHFALTVSIALFLIFGTYLFFQTKSSILISGHVPTAICGGGVCLIFAITPSILTGNLFFQNWGPDLDGNLIVSSYISNGKKFADLVVIYQDMIGTDWWNSERMGPWLLANTTDGIAVEFFLRSNRYGQAVEAAYLSKTLNIPVWLSFKSQMLASGILFSIFLFNHCRRLNLNSTVAFLVTLIFCTSQTMLFYYFEGINIQFIYLPICMFVLSNLKYFNAPERPEFIISLMCLGLLTVTFGDIIIVLLIWMATLMCLRYREIANKDWLRSITLISIGFVAIFFTPISDFIFWSFIRIRDGFTGGALHFNFSILSTLIPLPYFSISELPGKESIDLFFTPRIRHNLMVEAAMLLMLLCAKIEREKKIIFLSVLITLIIVTLTKHLYALWKAAVVFSPFVIPYLLSLSKQRYSKIMLCILTTLLVVNSLNLYKTMLSYSKITKPFVSSQMSINDYPAEACFAFFTPSDKASYLRLANFGQFHWLNEAHRQFDIKIDVNQMSGDNVCAVYAYYDCSIEGAERCKDLSDRNIATNTFQRLNINVNDISTASGRLDENLVEAIITNHFGLN